MCILQLVLAYTFLYQLSYSTNISDNRNLTCVNLPDSTKHPLNKYLCQQIGIKPCNTQLLFEKSDNSFLSIDKHIIQDSPNPQLCINKILSLLATLTCIKSNGVGFIGDNSSYNSITGETTIFISNDICRDIWEGCSTRGISEYAYLFKERESLRFCNSLTTIDSPVKIAQCDEDNSACIERVVNISDGEISELNWLLGGGIDNVLLQSKIGALTVIGTFAILGISLLMLNRTIYKRRIKKKSNDDILHFDLNLL